MKQEPNVKKEAIIKTQNMLSTLLSSTFFSTMSLKKDIQATQSHKVKHCALKSSRERVCIPLTSLLTDS